jgi:predicted MPP superfamily phosphohydrolase
MRWVEPWWFEITTVPIALGLDRPRPLRLLHLSDFHASEVVPFELIERAILLGIALQPQLICLTGDFITYDLPDAQRYRQLLAKLAHAAPCYASLGNHDGGPWVHSIASDEPVRSLLATAGITVLKNDLRHLTIDGTRLCLVGVGDLWNDELDPSNVLARHTAADVNSPPCIVLGHNPDGKTLLDDYAWNLLLCGHTHGGQLLIPFTGAAPFAPVHDKRYIRGCYRWHSRWLHVSAGVGNLHGVRLNSRPQVSLLELS